MLLETRDFNGADVLANGKYASQMADLQAVLTAMPLHVKESDQDGIQGNAIFDPVGTNRYIEDNLTNPQRGWQSGVKIPEAYKFLGKGVDFANEGIIVEAQFSNYPFLLNNTVRAELLFKSQTGMPMAAPEILVIISKAGCLPASNSTLYFEQAERQLAALVANKVFDIPLRLIGLFERTDTKINAQFTEYHARRYSRTRVSSELKTCTLTPTGVGVHVQFI